MHDFLDVLAQAARLSINTGYYEDAPRTKTVPSSLKQAIIQTKGAAVIAEVKAASPSKGIIKEEFSPKEVAKSMEKGGAAGISVITEPVHFHGSISNFAKIRAAVNLPLLIKDIIISPMQLEVAKQVGANAVLLIQTLFERGYCELDAHNMIAEAHKLNIEVLLEAHTKEEFVHAVESSADLIGINNRDLATLTVELNVTRDILRNVDSKGKIVVSESGIDSADDIRFLRKSGAHAFLVGSAVMIADDVKNKVKELVQA